METSNLKLALFLAEYKHRPFVFGDYDCNIFTSEWVDKVKDTDITAGIRGQYSTVKEMLRFSKVKKIKDELAKAGYQVIKDNPKTGDILIRKDKAGYYHSAIVMQGCAYTMDQEKGLAKADLNTVMLPGTEIWRTV